MLPCRILLLRLLQLLVLVLLQLLLQLLLLEDVGDLKGVAPGAAGACAWVEGCGTQGAYGAWVWTFLGKRCNRSLGKGQGRGQGIATGSCAGGRICAERWDA